MRIVRCDRCGTEEKLRVVVYGYYGYNEEIPDSWRTLYSKDLCSDCVKRAIMPMDKGSRAKE